MADGNFTQLGNIELIAKFKKAHELKVVYGRSSDLAGLEAELERRLNQGSAEQDSESSAYWNRTHSMSGGGHEIERD